MNINSVSFKYGKKLVLDSVNFTIHPNQIIGLIGENGCGKSTLIQLLAGIKTPYSGTITLDGHPVTRRLTDKIAYQPDIDLMYGKFTGDQVFDFYASQYKDFDIKKAYEIARFFNVQTNIKLEKLSKGNRGRIKLTLLLARNVSIYLLDEPFSGLDPLARESLLKAIVRFIDLERASVLLSTHEVSEVESILDEVILLKNGKIKAVGNLEQIREERGENAVEWMKSLYAERVN